MIELVPIEILKPHPKNRVFFPDYPREGLWREMVADIKENGIINPLIVAEDYTVLAGHLRLEIAKEIGFTHVKVDRKELPPESDYAISLMIRENLFRRHLSEMQIVKLIDVLKEQYGIKKGGDRRSKEAQESKGQNVLLKIAEVLGIGERQVKRLDKLNDLIPELQSLVDSGKLGVTAAYTWAFFPPEIQRALFAAYGDKIAELTQTEAKDLRRKIETEIRAETEKQVSELKQKIEAFDRQKKELQVLHEERETELKRAIADLQENIRESVSSDKVAYLRNLLEEKEKLLSSKQKELVEAGERHKQETAVLKERLKKLESRPQLEVNEKIVEKVVFKPDPAQGAALEAAKKEAKRLAEELQKALEDKEYQQASLDSLLREKELLEKRIAHLEKGAETTRRIKEKALPVPLKGELDKIGSLSTDLLLLMDKVLNSPDLDELAGMVKAAGVTATEDPGEKLIALANHFDAGTLFVFTVGVLKQLAAKAYQTAKRLENAFKSQPRLKVVKKEGGK